MVAVSREQWIIGAVVGVVVLGVGIGIGVGIGFAASPSPAKNIEIREEIGGISEKIQDQISNDNIRDNLRVLTAVPHIAGTPADRQGAEYLRDQWLAQGLDSAQLKPYKVLLQYPPEEAGMENKVQIFNNMTSEADFTSALKEDTFGEEELEQDGIPPPYNAYSGTGDVRADMVYVNYGRIEDYEFLKSINVTLEGNIFIARYGGIGRSRKTLVAQMYGGAGLVLYSDPQDYSVPIELGKPYPDGPWLPDTGAQRGSIFYDAGDPLTPHYPATEDAFREVPEDVPRLPVIPVHPIANKDAAVLLSNLAPNADIPADWSGDLEITYGSGPGFADGPYKDRLGRIVVNSKNSLRWAYNVIGFIRGELEPDRYVLIGNHRDAWGLGSVDPTSGTASLLEITRVFGKMKKEGWRPRRTLVFCSWGAEEFGLIGSVEWTEEFYYLLAQRSVAYLNLDIAVYGDHVLGMSATPHMKPIVFESTKKVVDPSPSGERKTVYDTMKERRPVDENDPETLPRVGTIGAGSDYYGFQFGVGVSCISGSYQLDFDTYDVRFYALYHMSYETFRLMDEFIDPEFKAHQAIARSFAEMLRMLGDVHLLPLDVREYAQSVEGKWNALADHEWYQQIEAQGIQLKYLASAVANFTEASMDFQSRLENVDRDSVLAVHSVNDQMMLLDRSFMMTVGHLPGQPLERHIIYSGYLSPVVSEYPTSTFPGIYDIMSHILRGNPTNPEEQWRNLERHVSIMTYMIQSAAATLFEVTTWA